MSAIVCGKRSSIFEDLPSSSPSSAASPSSPPSAKRIRCSSFSPPRSSAAAASLFSAASWTSVSSPLGYLIARFPSMDKELLEKALHECGDDLDSTIKSLNELFLGSGENMGSAAGKPVATSEAGTQILNQGNSTSYGDGAPQEQPSANKQLPFNREEFVEIFVREMSMASNIDDAKARASRALEVFEKSIYANASETARQSFQQENLILKQQLEAVLQENNILKRAVSIQHERQKEFEERGQEVNQLKQLLAQYQEQLRTLEVNNYALAMHLKQAQQSNSMPGRFNPDIF